MAMSDTITAADRLSLQDQQKAQSTPTNKWCNVCGKDFWTEYDMLSHYSLRVGGKSSWVCPLEVKSA